MLQRFLTLILSLTIISGTLAVPTVRAQDGAGCTVIAGETATVYFAPLQTANQFKERLPAGSTYTIVGAYGENFYQIEYNGGDRGWITYDVFGFRPECMANWLDVPLTVFPTLCFYTTSETLQSYFDIAMTQPYDEIVPGTFPLLWIENNAFALQGGESRAGGVIPADRGAYSGLCSGSVNLALAGDETNVWSMPDASAGEIITALEPGTQLVVAEGPVPGPITSDATGDWFRVAWGDDDSGWVWADRLTFRRTFTAPRPIVRQMEARTEARMWSLPDVTAGQVVMTVPQGVVVNITGEAVTGPIRLDSDATGDWLPVQRGGTVGWMLVDALQPPD